MNAIDPIKSALFSGLEKTINQCLQYDPDTLERVAALDGKVIAIELQGINVSFYLLPCLDCLQVSGTYEGTPDTTLKGTPLALMRVTMANDKQAALFGGDVEISGDTETGEQIKEILDNIDIDWEEQLSVYTGDVIAHKVGNIFRGMQAWSSQTKESMCLNISEYLQEESRLLPYREEINVFLSGVDALRGDVDRLEQRIMRLHSGLGRQVENNKTGVAE